jgi:hypothetical protein
MRLINVQTLQLEKFFESSTPPYAILSHTWGVEEVTYLEFQGGGGPGKQGFGKIKNCCKQARKDGITILG